MQGVEYLATLSKLTVPHLTLVELYFSILYSREGSPEPENDNESDQTHDNLVQSVQILEGEPSNKKRRSNL